MSMKVAKRGTRASGVRITINKKMQAVHFSAGFFRQYKFGKENAKYVLTGYDRDSKEIGFQFLKSNENQKEALTLTYSQSGSSAYATIKPILATFNLKIDSIAGEYSGDAIEGPKKIEGFGDNAFILKVEQRKK